jgi:hypothetical protein
MNGIASLLKSIAVIAVVALVGYVLYQMYKAFKAGQSAWQGAADAISRAKSSVESAITPGQSSIVPTPGNMPAESKSWWDRIKAGEPTLNTPAPATHWWQETPGETFRRIFNLGGTSGTTQTLGTQQNSVNLDPLTIKNFTPSAQGGSITAAPQAQTGTLSGSFGSNALPPPSVNIAPPSAGSTTPGTQDMNYVAPGAGSMINNAPAGGGSNAAPPSGEPDTSQLQFLGQ